MSYEQGLGRIKVSLCDFGTLSPRSLMLCFHRQPACWTLLRLYLPSCGDSGTSRETCWLFGMLETKLL